ncbi:MAG: secretin N-terminal domain-containing protein [Candidatus Ozemobacteraceae bacterium]
MNSTGHKRLSLIACLAILAAFAGWVQPPAVYAEDNISLDFRDADIRDILKIIAQKSGTNIIAEKSVRGNVTVRLNDVYYEEAMNLIAKTNGFAVRKIGNTWVLADEKKLIESFEKGLTITKRLQYAKAGDVSKIIISAIKKDIKVATDDRINAVIVSGSKDMLDEVKKLIETVDTPVHQVMIESKIVEVGTTGRRSLGFDWAMGNSKDGAGTMEGGEGSKPLFVTKEYFAKNPDENSYQAQFGGQPQGALFGLGDFYRASTLFQATFKALEAHTDSKVLSNPKISAVNGQEAYIKVGQKVIYPGGADQPPKEKDTGIILKITPRINDDGYVTADIEPEVSFVEKWQGQYPIIGNRQAKTTVRVKDGEEILIGGLIKETEGNSSSKIPFLGNIPIIKSLFTSSSKNGDSQELIILITPHIVAQSIESSAPTSLIPEGGNEAPAPSAPAANKPAQPAGNAGDGFDTDFDKAFN